VARGTEHRRWTGKAGASPCALCLRRFDAGGGQRRHTTRREQMAVLAGVRLRAASAAPRVEQAALAGEWRRHQRAGRRGGHGVEHGAVEQCRAAPRHALRGHRDGRGASSLSGPSWRPDIQATPSPRTLCPSIAAGRVAVRADARPSGCSGSDVGRTWAAASPVLLRGMYLVLYRFRAPPTAPHNRPLARPSREAMRVKGERGCSQAQGEHSLPEPRCRPHDSPQQQHGSTAAQQHRSTAGPDPATPPRCPLAIGAPVSTLAASYTSLGAPDIRRVERHGHVGSVFQG
jgi:hypothetical protein